ncbi:diguanylate cyclase [uncultured Jatrophihabitans sp.]|uniref:GGDEF domain-containing protein n=1 Tax=uncultured Jatrophihabitans sp. TaxID=1610747 RepID=UPI0035CA1B79
MPKGHITYLISVDAVVLAWAAYAVVRGSYSVRSLAILGLVAALAVIFEEVATRAARLKLRLSAELKRDMVSVWAVAAAIALPASSAVLLLGGVLVYIWFRQQRPTGQPLNRKWFNGSTEILGCLVAGVFVRSRPWEGLPLAGSGALLVLVATLIYAAINRALVTAALVSVGVRGRALLGGKDDNLVELATLCLGGLVSLALLHEPWLVLLSLVPMITLQRGAVVRELETVATTDAKTGLLNAVALEHVGQREVSRAEREDSALAVLIVDIDRFKRVNDRFGHLVGDAVLRGVGQALESGLREYDTVGRFGGEEFVALLPTAHEAEALVVAERLRAAVAALRISEFDPRIEDATDDGLSVSIGVACFGTHGVAMTDLLFAADTALYRAKNEGRNRVVLAHRGTEEPARESSLA